MLRCVASQPGARRTLGPRARVLSASFRTTLTGGCALRLHPQQAMLTGTTRVVATRRSPQFRRSTSTSLRFLSK
eukprot:7678809-Alexandrium_andersonii.AAC.1